MPFQNTLADLTRTHQSSCKELLSSLKSAVGLMLYLFFIAAGSTFVFGLLYAVSRLVGVDVAERQVPIATLESGLILMVAGVKLALSTQDTNDRTPGRRPLLLVFAGVACPLCFACLAIWQCPQAIESLPLP